MADRLSPKLALQLRFLFEVSAPCHGLLSASPKRPIATVQPQDAYEFGRVPAQAVEPRELIIKLGPWLRIAVRRVEAADQDPVDCCFDVAALQVRLVTAPLEEALTLQRPLPPGALKIVAKGKKKDGGE